MVAPIGGVYAFSGRLRSCSRPACANDRSLKSVADQASIRCLPRVPDRRPWRPPPAGRDPGAHERRAARWRGRYHRPPARAQAPAMVFLVRSPRLEGTMPIARRLRRRDVRQLRAQPPPVIARAWIRGHDKKDRHGRLCAAGRPTGLLPRNREAAQTVAMARRNG